MLPRQLRVGDLVDDYCPRERRLSDHAIVALVGEEVRRVRCTTCDAEHEYRGGKVPVSRKKVFAVAPPPIPPARVVEADTGRTEPVEAPPATAEATVPPPGAIAAPGGAVRPVPAQDVEAEPIVPPTPHAEFSLHRRLIRATLPRAEGEVPARPIPEFTMHRAASTGHRFGKPFRHAQGGGGPHRQDGKGGPGAGRPGGQRPGRGEVDGNSFTYRGGGQGQHGTHGGPGSHGGHGGHGTRSGQGQPHGPSPRHGFGGKPPRGPRKP